ncbi:phosphate acetyltransferase [Antribacter gilvus]|uniref:phosphate acetyltransferase n=1 Tax=Antribacter gilvus TaxID=2304675 RepID=UPI000F7A8A94|nr:phosphate acetyltransferase [Antribacter gilvus]
MTASPTVRSLVIASPEGETGKSTVALGVLDLLVRQVQRVGVFRAVSRVPAAGPDLPDRDYVLEMLLDHDGVDVPYEDAVGVTYDEVHADPEAALSRIVSRYHAMAAHCDAVVVLGTDYTDVAGPTELSFNARIAANLGAPVLLVVSGRERTADAVRALAEVSLAELRANHAQPVGIVVNRCGTQPGSGPDDVRAALTDLRTEEDLPVWVIPEEPFLTAPTVGQLLEAVDGVLALGDPELLTREALDVLVGAMSFEHLLERLSDGAVVITPGDRTDVLIGLLAAQTAPTFPSLAGIVLGGGFYPEGRTAELVAALEPKVPIIRTDGDTYPVARAAAKTRGRVSRASTRKIDTARALFEKNVDGEELAARLDVPPPQVVTPLMFEYRLIERAREERRHVVLPEGDDDRILRAASTVLARGIADLTILGEETAVRGRATELGLDLEAARVLSTTDPESVERFSTEYARLRAHKGMTVERAREVVTDVSYFGTMMVHLGLADGMVSGAAHSTAHTIRPSFEIIKTQPGVSSVSSVFLMCLEDRVLVYGDCAVIPDPTAEELADIAISSSATATQFGVAPRIAMLSYSTGTSGSGADVDKVRTATALVRERRPDLDVEGPIQYDAAVDASVAASKLPGSDVAGRATVFVFPDLNTGNNTYKAVQRSAGAVAVGPVLQGLNKPVNDLSRGALVQDIVNTVAITAIQAQGATR